MEHEPDPVSSSAVVNERRRLRQPALWRSPSPGSVTWTTTSLPAVLAARAAARAARTVGGERPPGFAEPPAPIVRQSDTAVTLLAVPKVVRDWSVSIVQARAEVIVTQAPTDSADLSRRVQEHHDVVSARHPGPWDADPYSA